MRIVTEKHIVMPKRATPDTGEICFHMHCDGDNNPDLCDQCVFGNLKNYEATRELVNSDVACIERKEGMDIRRTK